MGFLEKPSTLHLMMDIMCESYSVKRELHASAKSIDPRQPAEMGQNFKLFLNFLHIKVPNDKRAWPLIRSPWAFQIVWCSIKKQGFKSQPVGYKHRFFYDLTW